MEDFSKISYKLHEKEYLVDDEITFNTWFKKDTIDYWRHMRMFHTVASLLRMYPHSKWVTIGDGRYGLDSINLKTLENTLDILPTDISPTLLKSMKERGIIADYGVENAENLSFDDNTFDFAFCKESYHHFPRPYIAVYEMLRVAKNGIVIIEPNDIWPMPFPGYMLYRTRQIIKRMIEKELHHRDKWRFEMAGNYVYSLSKREMEKLAIGIQLPMIAIKYFNDYYEKGLEQEPAAGSSGVFKKVKNKIKIEDLKCKIGLKTSTHVTIIIFKKLPLPQVVNQLKRDGFQVIDLPTNHYLEPTLLKTQGS